MSTTPAVPGREIRIALVCFGGSSLAIYMHGITKEIHRLIKASRRWEATTGGAEGPDGDPQPSECAWLDILSQLQSSAAPITSVAVDIISGTSAGGINGVALALALATGASQDSLRDLWLNEADFGQLVPGPRWVPWSVRAVPALAGLLVPFSTRRGVLDGDRMSRVLVDALTQMSEGAASLVPPGQRLDLYVTATDYNGQMHNIPILDRVVTDRAYRRVLHFRHDTTGDSDFIPTTANPDPVSALAFAARASAAFPAAFSAVSADSFGGCTGRRVAASALRKISGGTLAGEAELLDGGVTDNEPFGYAVNALDTAVDSAGTERWLVYVQPDPTETPLHEPRRGTPRAAAVGTRLIDMLRAEPMVDDLRRVAAHNQRVASLARIVEAQGDAKGDVMDLASLALTVGAAGATDGLWPAFLQARATADERLDQALGLASAPYRRLRVVDLADGLATRLADNLGFAHDGAEAARVAQVLQFALLDEYDRCPGAFREAGIYRALDAPFVERAIRFALLGVRHLRTTTALGEAEARRCSEGLIRALEHVRRGSQNATLVRVGEERAPTTLTAAAIGEYVLRAQSRDLSPLSGGQLDEAAQWLAGIIEEHAVQEEVEAAEGGALMALLEICPDDAQQFMLSRYIGHGLWDALVLPATQLTGLTGLHPIHVARFSPGQGSLPEGVSDGPLAGMSLGHFGAFASKNGRQSDYLRGRLDAAAQLGGLLGADSDSVRACQEAILREEGKSSAL